MNYVKIISFQILLLSSSFLLPAEASMLAAPLIDMESKSPSCCSCSCATVCTSSSELDEELPTPASQESKARGRGCVKTSVAFSIALMVAFMLPELMSLGDSAPAPTPAPVQYYEERFEVAVSPICSDACPALINREDMCIPVRAEWHSILKRIADICPNSTKIELRTYTARSSTPLRPCLDVNSTVQDLATTCSPRPKAATGATAIVVNMDDVRTKFREGQKQRAKLRNPAHLRG